MIFSLELECELENVCLIRPPELCAVQIKCTSCREIHDQVVHVSRTDDVSISGSRGRANFTLRCRTCRRESSINLLETFEYTGGRSTVMKLECRGLEVLEWFLVGDYTVNSLKSSWIANLGEEWSDFDENENCPVSVLDIRTFVN